MTSVQNKIGASSLSSILPSIKPLNLSDKVDVNIDSKYADPKDIEKKLIDLGFVPLEKVLVKTEDEIECKYIKAVNIFGDTVFIHLDVDGIIDAPSSSPCLVKKEKSTFVPYSLKIASADCLNMAVCGVAFVCDNEYCVLERDSKGENIEENSFTVEKVNKNGTSTIEARKEGSIIPYPVVRLSEIFQNPSFMYSSIYENTKRIMNNAFNTAEEGVINTASLFKDLINGLTLFSKNKQELSTTIGEDIQELEKYLAEYETLPNKTPEQKELRNKVARNLRVRHEMIVEIIGLCQKVSSFRRELTEMKDKVEKAIEAEKLLFSKIGTII